MQFRPYECIGVFVTTMRLPYNEDGPLYMLFQGISKEVFPVYIRHGMQVSLTLPNGISDTNSIFIGDDELLKYGDPNGKCVDIAVGHTYSVVTRGVVAVARDMIHTSIDDGLRATGYTEFVGNVEIRKDEELTPDNLNEIGDVLYDEYVEMSEGDKSVPVHVVVVSIDDSDLLLLISSTYCLMSTCEMVREMVEKGF